jgi:lipoate-protein ligase A
VKLFDLGRVPWEESQLLYHALAILGHESLTLVSPDAPYVCIGYHQDVQHEVDVDFCRANSIPIFRREVGGGAVYLDGNQLFFQLVLRRDNPEIPPSKRSFYRRFLQPVINVYRHIGIPAEYKPVNDIVVGNRKISGTGVGEIGECIVFVGNLILDFDYTMMSRILKVPDEKFRDRVQKTIEENLTTIKRELGDEGAASWDESSLIALMIEEFEEMLGALEPCGMDNRLTAEVNRLRVRMLSDDWLFRREKRFSGRSVRIRSGVTLISRMHKATGGLIRTDFEILGDRYANVYISGDFFSYPESAIEQLESMLEGRSPSEAREVVTEFYSTQEVEIPDVSIDDWVEVLRI